MLEEFNVDHVDIEGLNSAAVYAGFVARFQPAIPDCAPLIRRIVPSGR